MGTPISRLWARLRELEMSEADLARKIGETPQTVNNWKARGSVPGKKAPKVAHAVGRSADWLLTGENHHPGVSEPDAPYYGKVVVDTRAIRDRRVRKQAEDLIRRLAAGEITPDKFDAALRLLKK